MGNYLVKRSNSSFNEKSKRDENRKRRRGASGDDDESDTDNDNRSSLSGSDRFATPVKKKLKKTSQYIYDTLFVNGENSDVSVQALSHRWELHKVYLNQSPYFRSMFYGGWKESDLAVIDVQIPDPNIDRESFNTALGSLYSDCVMISPQKVVSVAASASLLQLNELLAQCADIMMNSVSTMTMSHYYEAAELYGLQNVKDGLFRWLQRNLIISQDLDLLRQIDVSLMEKIVASSDLLVLQVEIDVYIVLKKWMFLQLSPQWNGSPKMILSEADAFFKTVLSTATDRQSFLLTEVGAKFVPAFEAVRYQYVICDHAVLRTLETDQIVPLDWLSPYFIGMWKNLLRFESGEQFDPNEINGDVFLANCMRCGRILPTDKQYCWRWTGFHHGIDFVICYSNRLLTIMRNVKSNPYTGLLQNTPWPRELVYSLKCISLDKQGHTVYEKCLERVVLSLSCDEEVALMIIDQRATFPLYLSFNFMFYWPIEASLNTATTIGT